MAPGMFGRFPSAFARWLKTFVKRGEIHPFEGCEMGIVR